MIPSGWLRYPELNVPMNARVRIPYPDGGTRGVAIVAALIACIMWPDPAISCHENYAIYEAAASSASITGIRVASSDDDVTVVAWRDAHQMIWTRTIAGGEFGDPLQHGTGGQPDLIHTPAGFTLAFSSENDLVIRDSDGTTWYTSACIPSVTGAAPAYPDLGRGYAPAAEDLYLAWCEGTDLVILSRRTSGSWQVAESVYNAPEWASVNRPRVAAYMDDGHPRPRVYFAMGQGYDYVYVQEREDGWSEQIPLYHGAFGAELSVAVDSNLLHAVAGLGPQPT